MPLSYYVVKDLTTYQKQVIIRPSSANCAKGGTHQQQSTKAQAHRHDIVISAGRIEQKERRRSQRQEPLTLRQIPELRQPPSGEKVVFFGALFFELTRLCVPVGAIFPAQGSVPTADGGGFFFLLALH